LVSAPIVYAVGRTTRSIKRFSRPLVMRVVIPHDRAWQYSISSLYDRSDALPKFAPI
jgi:hypothetical protein